MKIILPISLGRIQYIFGEIFMPTKPFDMSKFRKDVTKKLGVLDGFHNPKTWMDTGNYCLNYRISGDFHKGIPLDGKVTCFAGESGSGKSYFVSGMITKYCLENDISVVMLDSEEAVDRAWIEKFGVDPDDPQLMRIPVSSPDDCAQTINTFMELYKKDNENVDKDDCPKVLFIIDSLGMLSTKTEQDQFAAGDMKGDMGRKAKALRALVTQCIRIFNGWPVGLIATNHTYKSQDMFNPDDVVSGGAGFVFASSILVLLNKLKLKKDEDGNKISEVRGIRSKVKVQKTRYAKPFEDIEIEIPYATGLNKYSGLIEMFEKSDVLIKDGNKLKYTDKSGEEHKYFRKNIPESLLDLIMAEWEEPKYNPPEEEEVNEDVE